MPMKNRLKIAGDSGCLCTTLSDEEKMARLKELLELYKGEKGNRICALYLAQSIFGYLPGNVIRQVAVSLNYPVVKVAGVATFYSFFNKYPKGKYTIKVCLGTACYVRGGKVILEKLKKVLDIKAGETTPDGLFSLEVVRCVGACALAPVVVVNNVTHKRMKAGKLRELLNKCREEAESEKDSNS